MDVRDKHEVARAFAACDQTDDRYEALAGQLWSLLNAGERDTLICLVEQGPVWDGDVPSKSARDSLLEMGLAHKAVAQGAQGYQVANYRGWAVWREGPGAPARSHAAELARVGYEAYGEVAEWRAYNGEAMPRWDDLPDHIHRKWQAAAVAIIEHEWPRRMS